MLDGLAYLESEEICHGALSCHSVLVSASGHVKIGACRADHSVATVSADEVGQQIRITAYVPPAKGRGTTCDRWASLS